VFVCVCARARARGSRANGARTRALGGAPKGATEFSPLGHPPTLLARPARALAASGPPAVPPIVCASRPRRALTRSGGGRGGRATARAHLSHCLFLRDLGISNSPYTFSPKHIPATPLPPSPRSAKQLRIIAEALRGADLSDLAAPAEDGSGKKKRKRRGEGKATRAKKDPDAPKRPPSAFLIYLGDERKTEEFKNLPGSYAEKLSHVGETWKNMDEADRAVRSGA
jgi:hypothetical protein